MEQVRLPDLEVIKRFSIAVRREHAPVEEVVEALQADLEKISGGGRARRDTPAGELAARERRLPKPKAATRRTRATGRASGRDKRR